jgi:hypothetical protein
MRLFRLRLADSFVRHQLSKTLVCCHRRAVLSTAITPFHFLKNSIDGAATRRIPIDSQLSSQPIQENSVRVI